RNAGNRRRQYIDAEARVAAARERQAPAIRVDVEADFSRQGLAREPSWIDRATVQLETVGPEPLLARGIRDNSHHAARPNVRGAAGHVERHVDPIERPGGARLE